MRRLVRRARGQRNAGLLHTQSISLQTLNRSVLEYDVDFHGAAEVFNPPFPPVGIPRFIGLQWMPRVIPPAYSFAVKNALISRHQVVDPDNPGRVFLELLPDPTPAGEDKVPIVDLRARERMASRKPPRSEAIPRAFLFSNANWDNYYHFLIDSLCRYADARVEGILTPDVRLLFHSRPNAWQSQFLDLLGITVDDRDIVRAENVAPLQAGELIIVSPPRSRRLVSRRAAENLRRLLSTDTARRGGTERIYLTRRLAGKRRVINEDEVLDTLERRGFGVVEAERLTVKDQIAAFANARCIVGPHGAGLANMVFATEPAVVELLPADRWNLGGFAALTLSMGGRYEPVVSAATGVADTRALRTDEDDRDFSVDIGDLRERLDRVGV